MRFTPRVTVAAVIEQEGRFLMVEESIDGRRLYNQPAGHLEDGEGLLDAVAREVLEETARAFRPTALIGLYRWRRADSGTTFLRAAFAGDCGPPAPQRSLDPDIIATQWMDAAELEEAGAQLRSPLVLAAVRDYRAGRRYPLDLLVDLDWG